MNTPDISRPAPAGNALPVLDPLAVPALDPLAASLGRQTMRADGELHKSPSDVLLVGVIGYGYWGPNVVRNLHSLESCEVVSVCDKNPAVLKRARRQYPGIEMTTEVSDILRSPKIDAVAIVTPVWTHFELAKAALESGKHVFLKTPGSCPKSKQWKFAAHVEYSDGTKQDYPAVSPCK